MIFVVALGWVGSAGTDWPPVGAGERRGRSDEQRAGLWWHVQQRVAQRHLLITQSLLGDFHLKYCVLQGISFSSNPKRWDKALMQSFWSSSSHVYLAFSYCPWNILHWLRNTGSSAVSCVLNTFAVLFRFWDNIVRGTEIMFFWLRWIIVLQLYAIISF